MDFKRIYGINYIFMNLHMRGVETKDAITTFVFFKISKKNLFFLRQLYFIMNCFAN